MVGAVYITRTGMCPENYRLERTVAAALRRAMNIARERVAVSVAMMPVVSIIVNVIPSPPDCL